MSLSVLGTNKAEVLPKAISVHLAQMKVSASKAQIEQLLAWLQLLKRWNEAFNLTAIPSEQYIAQFVLMSAAAIPYLKEGLVLDVGSGAGVPGIALAILAPGNDYTLIECNGKKTRFLKQCQLELQLSNVNIVHERVERFEAAIFDTIISRAFASLVTFFDMTRHLSHQRTGWITFKGATAADDVQHSLLDEAKCQLHQRQIPGIEQIVSLITIQKKE